MPVNGRLETVATIYSGVEISSVGSYLNIGMGVDERILTSKNLVAEFECFHAGDDHNFDSQVTLKPPISFTRHVDVEPG